MIFIDGSNMYHSLKAYFKRTDIDLGCFSNKILDKRRLVRMYYYNAVVGKVEEPERFKDQEKFFKSVAAIPYTELRLGRLVYTNQWPNSPPFEKGVDVQLATDMITHAFKNNYDVAILVAGDNDFVGAIQAVKDNGKHVEVALFGQERTSRQLRDVADRVIVLDGRILRGCWKGPPPPGPNAPRHANHSEPRKDIPNGQRNEPRKEARIETRHEPRDVSRNEPRDEALSESNPEPFNDFWNNSRFEA
ncbi:MAG: NYN domain-containing protein [Dehalococcoidia bacterium]|nr:MAG: NYN domain-containing protein [Dehalococcoidia bacterium]